MRTCEHGTCEGRHYSHGLCVMHLRRRQNGLPMDAPFRIPSDPVLRFWSKVDRTGGADSCWIWQSAVTTSGYGHFRLDGRVHPAHRVSFEWATGQQVPSGMVIDHRCHVLLCVRPDHLRMVTHKQNCEHRMGAQVNSATGVRGVTWDPRLRKFRAEVRHNQRRHYLGLFLTIEEADEAATAKRNELFTHNDADRGVA